MTTIAFYTRLAEQATACCPGTIIRAVRAARAFIAQHARVEREKGLEPSTSARESAALPTLRSGDYIIDLT